MIGVYKEKYLYCAKVTKVSDNQYKCTFIIEPGDNGNGAGTYYCLNAVCYNVYEMDCCMTVTMAFVTIIKGVYAHSLSIAAALGYPLQVNCTAGGLYKPHIEFQKLNAAGTPVAVKPSSQVSICFSGPMKNKTAQLTFHSYKRDHAGIYRCEATENGKLKFMSKDIKVFSSLL
jgi:hypothetical protein